MCIPRYGWKITHSAVLRKGKKRLSSNEMEVTGLMMGKLKQTKSESIHVRLIYRKKIMKETMILDPLDLDTSPTSLKKCKENYKMIRKYLIRQMPACLITESAYIDALR